MSSGNAQKNFRKKQRGMGLKPFRYPDDLRFLKYLNCVHKFKIHFSENVAASLIPKVQDDIEFAIEHILIGIPECVTSIRTKTVTISLRINEWICKKQPFVGHDGEELIPFSHSYKLFVYMNEEAPPLSLSSSKENNSFTAHNQSSSDDDQCWLEIENVSPAIATVSASILSQPQPLRNPFCHSYKENVDDPCRGQGKPSAKRMKSCNSMNTSNTYCHPKAMSRATKHREWHNVGSGDEQTILQDSEHRLSKQTETKLSTSMCDKHCKQRYSSSPSDKMANETSARNYEDTHNRQYCQIL